MQADLPWQTSTHKCQIGLTNWFWFAKSNLICKLNCRTELPNWIAQPDYPTELPNWIAKLNDQTKSPNWIAKLNCRLALPNWIAKLNYQTELPNQIWFTKRNCQIDLAYQIIEFAFVSAWMNLFLSCIYFLHNSICNINMHTNFYLVSQVWFFL
jgi:hypothetical protein